MERFSAGISRTARELIPLFIENELDQEDLSLNWSVTPNLTSQ